MSDGPAPGVELPTASRLERWGLDPRWSCELTVASHDGHAHRWHVLDTGPTVVDPVGTIVCVHGNPTWAYAWKSFLTDLGDRFRVVAVDQLGMGYSDRVGLRRYADRVRDLDDAIRAIDPDPSLPLFLAAHDWGGAIAMGWTVDHPERVDGLVLCNTGISVPEGRSAPGIIRLAASAPLRDLVCRRTSTFVEGTVRLSRGHLTALDREAFRAPYRTAASRAAIAEFVGDIPLADGHPSEAALTDVADRLGSVDCPVLLAWGAKDPVFDDDFAADLASRLPDTVLHRFPAANHLVMAEADVAGVAARWLADLTSDESARGQVAPKLIAGDGDTGSDESARGQVAPKLIAGDGDTGSDESARGQVAPKLIAGERLWEALERRRDDDETAFVDLATDTSLTFRELWSRVGRVAAELHRRGLQPGDRVAMVTPPGVDLIAALFGVIRAGGVAVVADRGLGLRGLGGALRSARPAWVVGPRAALTVAATMRWAPRARRLDVADLLAAEPGELPTAPGSSDPVAVLFTSGATGPAKGVRYRHTQLEAQRDALRDLYEITDADRLVAAFAPFSIYGPALGIPTALPDCDVTRPGELTANALDEACRSVGATLAFAAPAALTNVIATAAEMTDGSGLRGVRVVMSAGAPVPSETLRAVAELAPDAALRTPYGMTEALPVADIDLVAIERAEVDHPAAGVCVGRPVAGAEVRIVPLDFDPARLPEVLPTGETGEILVSAPWVSDGYVGLWHTERTARPPGAGRWHRSGDVGHVDDEGRLWVEGRAVHVIRTDRGPLASVPIERAVERGLPIARVAAVGVGPDGCQQVVVVLESAGSGEGLAAPDTAAAVRAIVDVPVAAVLTAPSLPVDIRHNSKIDRREVAEWAGALLAGGRARRTW